MRETTHLIGPERTLVATYVELNLAPEGVRSRRAVLLSNAGVISRVGPHRVNVTLARALARMGLPSVRFDTSGLGDSRRPSQPKPTALQFVADTRAVMDDAEQRLGINEFTMVGLCSGADIGYLTALEDDRLKAIVMFDPYLYPTWKTQCIRFATRVREFGFASAVMRVARATIKALSLRLPRARGVDTVAPKLVYGRSVVPTLQEFARRVESLLDRGIAMLFVYSGGEPDGYNYRGQLGDNFRGHNIMHRIDYAYLPEVDHMFTTRDAQTRFVELIVGWVKASTDAVPSRERASTIASIDVLPPVNAASSRPSGTTQAAQP